MTWTVARRSCSGNVPIRQRKEGCLLSTFKTSLGTQKTSGSEESHPRDLRGLFPSRSPGRTSLTLLDGNCSERASSMCVSESSRTLNG